MEELSLYPAFPGKNGIFQEINDLVDGGKFRFTEECQITLRGNWKTSVLQKLRKPLAQARKFR